MSTVKYLKQDEAIQLDKELFNEFGFSVYQLMELAGHSVACAVSKSYPVSKYNKPIICCGPGNNGGDGLVCARHLKLFGYSPIVVYLKPGKGDLYQSLVKQCQGFDINIVSVLPDEPLGKLGDIIIDSLFGFSFKPPNRNADFAQLLNQMDILSKSTQVPIVSVDIPSGWNVESGPSDIIKDHAHVDDAVKIPVLRPDCLVSLTAPKLCAKFFEGRYHYLGGRFCPPKIQNKYELQLPQYPSTEGVVLLNQWESPSLVGSSILRRLPNFGSILKKLR